MAIRCVPKSYGFAHICDICGAIGPIKGDFPELHDEAETRALGIACDGNPTTCSAALAGWLTGTGQDLCPTCRPSAATEGRAVG